MDMITVINLLLIPAVFAVLIGGVIIGSFRKYAAEKKAKNQAKELEASLPQSGFTVSRKVSGGFASGGMGIAGYTIFVDDINKKWMLTSPFFPQINKTFSFSDFVDCEFFDEEGSNINGKLIKGAGMLVGAITGATVGMMYGHGFLGMLAGGYGGNLTFKTKGETCAYGLKIKTTDSSVNNPYIVCDFCNVYPAFSSLHMGIFMRLLIGLSNKAKMGIRRSSMKYKKDAVAIKESLEVFEYIHQQNRQS
ncbi:MAG: hypothetical protein LBR76_05640 [Oscillospiraceae bacterium]|jgi:hypothetical protein|nr:hypothetical protein [Oscillospiraceae bacterium]